MKRIVCIAALFLIAAGGCGARNVYDGLRFRQDLDCQKLQGADRDECNRRSGMSYDEYQRQLEQRQPDR
jgi:hypothetical protein